MKITDLKLRLIKQPITTGFKPNWGRGIKMQALPVTIVQIDTDEGISGYAGGPTTGEELLAGINAFVRASLIGADPFNIEYVSEVLSTSALRMGWPWFVEAAVWDIIGKKTGQPVYKFFGGSRERLKVYASTGETRSAQQRLKDMQVMRKEGFRAIKLRFKPATCDELLETIRLLRLEHGNEIDIMVDANQADKMPGAETMEYWNVHDSIRLAEKLARYDVAWLEEPLPRHDYEGLQKLAKRSPIPLAGAEKNMGLREFKDLLAFDCYDILQPDCMFSGTMSQVKKIAVLAEACNKRVIPHTWSTGFGLFANLHICAGIPNCDWYEYPYDPPSWTHELNFGLFREPLEFRDGYVVVPQSPGLGYELNWEAVEKYEVK
ncbi:MAG: mandelate racemase/muconate lactonizing enzyme family protein [Bacillota bacterium]